MSNLDEANLILQHAHRAGLDTHPHGRHLVSKVTVLDYVRIANDIQHVLPRGKILDWGCGFGQISFLLQRRDLTVTSYDVAERAATEPSLVFPDVMITRAVDPVQLAFADDSFDAVLSCGVLEHVLDEPGSLAEIRRVLRAGGLFLIFNLPQSGSYKEAMLEKFRLGYTHERKYTQTSITRLLEGVGLRVQRVRRSGMLPHNLTPLPQLRGAYNFFARPILAFDNALSTMPLLNQIAEALEIVAVK